MLASIVVLAASTLSVQLSTDEATVLIGEPVRLVVTFLATAPGTSVKTSAVEVQVDDGTGYRDHFETAVEIEFVIERGFELKPGVPFLSGLNVAVAGTRGVRGDAFRFALPSPGTYRLRARYGSVVSNEVVLQVVHPQGRDAELYDTYLRQKPYLLSRWATQREADSALLEEMLQRFDGSCYLYLPKLLFWMYEIRQAELAFGQAGGGTGGQSPLDHHVGAVLNKIQAVDWRSRPAFDESRLALIAETRLKWGDREGAFAVYRQLIERYPDSPLAQAGRRLIGADDSTPPELVVSPSTTVLWPPNRAMIPIDVSVTAADDSGAVSVKLASITCNDGCNPALDVSGADYGTDDRSFVLRAERRGTSKEGRTYTITYTAEDAAGNTATATTTVTVPHDQGKKKK